MGAVSLAISIFWSVTPRPAPSSGPESGYESTSGYGRPGEEPGGPWTSRLAGLGAMFLSETTSEQGEAGTHFFTM